MGNSREVPVGVRYSPGSYRAGGGSLADTTRTPLRRVFPVSGPVNEYAALMEADFMEEPEPVFPLETGLFDLMETVLTEKEIVIVNWRVFSQKTFTEIAHLVGLEFPHERPGSEETRGPYARQVIERQYYKAIEKLKKAISSKEQNG